MKELLTHKIFIIGFIFVLLGVVLPFLMVIQVFESTIWLNFVAYAFSISGMFMGVIGTVSFVKERKDKEKKADDYKNDRRVESS